jgi:crossover junction endodeoxyribonuclease RusA
MTLTIKVYGIPGPQGSKSFKGMRGGHAIMVESSKKVKPWREAVKWAAREAMAGSVAIKGPVDVDMIFTLPKPSSAPKRRLTFPDRKPDLSKLVRSTEDALTDAGAWEDDARVIRCVSGKRYPNEGIDALDSPGCLIRISSVVADTRDRQITTDGESFSRAGEIR